MVFDYKNLKTYDELPNGLSEHSYAVLDPTRKGTDFVSMPIFRKDDLGYYYLTDMLFSQTSIKYLYDDIVNKIIDNRVIIFVIENNTDTSLKEVIESRLREKGYDTCSVFEKYAVQKKEFRINDMKNTIIDKIIFPKKEKFGQNTDIGKAMEQLNSYSFMFPNKHDDMPDSLALFGDQIILENAVPQKAVAMARPF